jgi:hypothetical protein
MNALSQATAEVELVREKCPHDIGLAWKKD